LSPPESFADPFMLHIYAALADEARRLKPRRRWVWLNGVACG
jgi:hypothetical protein